MNEVIELEVASLIDAVREDHERMTTGLFLQLVQHLDARVVEMRFTCRFHAVDGRGGGIEIVRERRQPERRLIEADDGDSILRAQQLPRELPRGQLHDRQLFEHRFGVVDEQDDVERLVGRRRERFDFSRYAVVEQRQLGGLRRAVAADD